MTLLSFEHLWSDIVGSTADGSLALAVEFEFRGETEISDLNLHLVVKEEVTELEISMDDSVTVEVLDSAANLVDVALDFQFVQTLASTKKLVE